MIDWLIVDSTQNLTKLYNQPIEELRLCNLCIVNNKQQTKDVQDQKPT